MDKITKQDFYKVAGLLTLADDAKRSLEKIEKALAEVLSIPDDGYGYYGHISDGIYSENYDADELLRKLNIKVEDD